MNFCNHCWIKVIGMYVLCDGWGSLIAYIDTEQRFWKDHLVRVVRMVLGIMLIICG